MRHEVHVALTQHLTAIDVSVQEALKEVCSEENIKAVVHRQVEETLNLVMKEEVERYFRYGAGRVSVKHAVIAKLSDSPLED